MSDTALSPARRRVDTTRFGVLDVADDDLIAVPGGLPGFPSVDHAVLLPVDDDGLFYWFQAVEEPDVAFLAMVPWDLFPGYEPELPDDDVAVLELHEGSDAVVLVIITVHRDPERFTGNLLAPLVINHRARLARQVILRELLPTQAPFGTPVTT